MLLKKTDDDVIFLNFKLIVMHIWKHVFVDIFIVHYTAALICIVLCLPYKPTHLVAEKKSSKI